MLVRTTTVVPPLRGLGVPFPGAWSSPLHGVAPASRMLPDPGRVDAGPPIAASAPVGRPIFALQRNDELLRTQFATLVVVQLWCPIHRQQIPAGSVERIILE